MSWATRWRRPLATACVLGGLTWWVAHKPPRWSIVHARDGDGKTLCALADMGKVDAMRKFLAENASADLTDRHPHGWTPLMVAAAHGDVAMVELLLEAGAAVDAEDNYSPARNSLLPRLHEFPQVLDVQSRPTGFTALFYAILAGSPEVVRKLLEAGADPNHKDAKGRTPLDLLPFAPHNATAIRRLFEEELPQLVEAQRRRERERRRQFPLESRFRERIVGQEGPITAVASAIRRKENGWQDSDHPLVFLFLGSSGIGKTELAKQMAEYLHGEDKEAFIRVDMSEYSSHHEASKFIGSPPGYVGHEEGGQLTKRLRKHPNAVVLLDEVEKAHPDVLTVMLQVFDEGRLTDGKGETIDCKDAVFVMTSNLAQREIADQAVVLRGQGREDEEFPEEFKIGVVQPILKHAFKRDEFLGRINEIIYFLPFTDAQLRDLAERQLQRWARRAQERHAVVLTWSPAVRDLVAKGYNLRYGARSIQHEVDRKVISKIAAFHEQDLIHKNSHVAIGVDPDSNEIQLQVSEGPSRSPSSILPAGARAALKRLF